MKTKTISFAVIALVAAGLIFAVSGCGKTDRSQEAAQTETKHEAEVVGAHEHEMAADKLAYVHEAEELYTCSHHTSIVSDNPEATCAECDMALTEMSDEAVAELRASSPKGCPMCNMVVPGDSEVAQCPKCGMDLVAVPESNPEPEPDPDPHAGHDH
jgi:hypothetical protein